MAGKIDLAIREKEAREAAIERCVDTRISEAMQCKICMDRAINTVFNPCCHVIACAQCAARWVILLKESFPKWDSNNRESLLGISQYTR